jgi:hypothetical protein
VQEPGEEAGRALDEELEKAQVLWVRYQAIEAKMPCFVPRKQNYAKYEIILNILQKSFGCCWKTLLCTYVMISKRIQQICTICKIFLTR